jgi:cytochrome c biogenesis protein CcdA
MEMNVNIYFIICVVSFLSNLVLCFLGIHILIKCKQKQSKDKIRNDEDKNKDSVEFFIFVAVLVLNFVLFTILLVLLFKCDNNITRYVNYYGAITFLLLSSICSYSGWDLTNRCDNETIVSDSAHMFKREIFMISSFIFTCISIIVISSNN